MIIIIVILFVGLFFGFLLKKIGKIKKYTKLGTNITIFLLLFLLGISVGANEKVIKNIDIIGVQALFHCFLAVFGSILVSYIVYKIFFKDIEHEK